MPDTNRLTISVRLGRDPGEVKQVGNEDVCNCSGAFRMGYGDNETSAWIDIAMWGLRASWFARDCAKGDAVIIDGELSCRTWEGRDGDKRETWGIKARTYQLVAQPREQPESRTEPESGNDGGTSGSQYYDDDDPGPSW